MIDIPNVLFLNFVDTPATVNYSQHCEASIPLNQANDPVDLKVFRKVSIMIGTTNANSCSMYMGKISGATLANSFDIPLNQKIHTFDVVGPQMKLWLKGATPLTSENVKLWIYLTS